MDRPESHLVASLARRTPPGADAAQLADALVSAWRDIGAALSPIIGAQGVAALYRRSLHVAAARHPWLAAGIDDAGGLPSALDTVPLKSLLLQQSVAEAAAAGHTQLTAFHDLLVSLVGPALTDRLLRPAGAHASSGPAGQDSSR